MAKRLLDIMGSLALLIILSPILLATALLVLAFLGRPVLFRQMRPGLHGRPFMLLKFRSMRPPRPGSHDDDAARLGRVGRALRASGLDELPELFNVLRGEMSLVGPRPLLMEYLPLYTPEQARRHLVRPGLTGWAQVHGRNRVDWPQRFSLDVWYVDHHSLWLDLRILVMTAAQLLRPSDASQSGHATMTPFQGAAGTESPRGRDDHA
jgi:sugar transferase EpsL